MKKALLLLLLFGGGIGQNLGLSGGDPPNPGVKPVAPAAAAPGSPVLGGRSLRSCVAPTADANVQPTTDARAPTTFFSCVSEAGGRSERAHQRPEAPTTSLFCARLLASSRRCVQASKPPPLKPPSAALVLRRLQDDDQDDSSWSRLAGTVREPVSYFKKVDEDSNTWGKAEGVVDASAPDVLAWLWHSCTHERNLEHERKYGNLLKMELDVPGTRSKFMVTSMKMPGAISNRVFANWWTWAMEQNGNLIAAFSSLESELSHPHPTSTPHH